MAVETARDIAGAIRRGEVSASDVCRDTLVRITAGNDAIYAFHTICADLALAQAAALDARRGEWDRLPLLGVPIALKDNLCTKGVTTTAGSRMLERYVPPYDSTAVARLVAAGAVIVGKTNCDEFAMGSSTENSAFAPTRNPWALDRIPGGSSGGSAAAVAARMVPLALGSDTGGSIRQPAALCGVVGLKPTYGRVSRYGLIAFASSLDQIGPIATTVADAALALQVMSGPDPRDATCATAPAGDYLSSLTGDVRGLRIGVPRALLDSGVDPEILAAFEAGVETLAQQGAVIVDVALPHSAQAIPVYYLVATAEASSNLARYDGVRYGFRAAAATLGEMYDRTRDQGFGARGQTSNPARHLRPERRLLRRVLPEGAAGPHAHPPRLRDRAAVGGSDRDADKSDARVPARRAHVGSAPDVPRGRFYGCRESRGPPRHFDSVRFHARRPPVQPAADRARDGRSDGASRRRRVRTRHDLRANDARESIVGSR